MIYLKPITYDNINDFAGTSYDTMSFEQKHHMIRESVNKIHDESYFEFLVIYEDNTVIGFMNLYAHSEHIISCGPTIKEKFQNRGYGFSAETKALEYAKDRGYTIAVAGVDENNKSSIALHEKLGFELERKYLGREDRTIRLYIKAL